MTTTTPRQERRRDLIVVVKMRLRLQGDVNFWYHLVARQSCLVYPGCKFAREKHDVSADANKSNPFRDFAALLCCSETTFVSTMMMTVQGKRSKRLDSRSIKPTVATRRHTLGIANSPNGQKSYFMQQRAPLNIFLNYRDRIHRENLHF